MMNKTAYLNHLTKEKQIDLNVSSLKFNLKNMKSINKNQQDPRIEINRNKGKYLRNRRDQEIDLQNDILSQKIDKIINSSRNSKYYSKNQKYSKSLNSYVKRTTQEKINDENLKLLLRLEESKPTYPTKKFLQEFQHIKKVQKKMSAAEFYLTESPTFRKRKLNTNGSFMSRRNSSFGQNSSFLAKESQFVKQTITLNDGKLWEIKIFQEENQVRITGQILMNLDEKDDTSTEIKLIQVPKFEAHLFVRKHCQNQLTGLIKHLKVDQKDGSLLLIAPQNNRSDSPLKHMMNPQQKKTKNEISSPSKKVPPRQIFNNIPKKPILLDELPKFGVGNQKSIELQQQQIVKGENPQKNILPQIQSKQLINPKQQNILEKSPISIQKISHEPKQKVQQKLKTRKSSISSIKQNPKAAKEQLKSSKSSKKKQQKSESHDEQIKIEQEKPIENQSFQKIQTKEKEQEKNEYEEQKFEESLNQKSSDKKKSESSKVQEIQESKEKLGSKQDQIEQKASLKSVNKPVKKSQQFDQSHDPKSKKPSEQKSIEDQIADKEVIQSTLINDPAIKQVPQVSETKE